MRFSTSVYYIEVREGNSVKRVPHTKKGKHTDFIDRQQAVNFQRELVTNNRGNSFRLCKRTTTETEYPWITQNK